MVISRRRFNQLLGGSALALPMVKYGNSWAQTSSEAPVRFLAVRTPHGVDRDFWIPKQTNGADPSAAEVPLTDLTFDYPQCVLQPLMAWREKMTILDGLDTKVCIEQTRGGKYGAHGHAEQGALLTGAQPPANRDGNYENHPSLDFWLHSQLGAPRLLTAAVIDSGGGWKAMSYNNAGLPISPDANPQSVFRSAFPADFMPTGPTGPTGPDPDPDPEPPTDPTLGEDRIGAYLGARLTALRNRLAGFERAKVQEHLEALATIMNLNGGSGNGSGTGSGGSNGNGNNGGGGVAACTVSGQDVPSRNGNVNSVLAVEEVTRAQAAVIAQAFACNRARCATLQILNDYPNLYSDLPEVRTQWVLNRFGPSFRFHEDLVHEYWNVSGQDLVNARVGYLAGLRWSSELFRIVLEELDNIPDPLDPNHGSVLDNTIVYWHNEFGHYGHDYQHMRHPVVIAGGGGKTLKIGRYLRLRNIASHSSSDLVPHNRLLTSICHAMGLTNVDYFGDRDLANRSEYRGPLVPLMA